ncbi:MAG: 1-acyl-sn-glycerol-3-phosphate acyltransferase [Bacteroidales bacterium]|nr:1-acyl-sn-glycerol-3-phosphate acyltransferase [Bacteroidales bacterium]
MAADRRKNIKQGMGRNNIEKTSAGYALLKFVASIWHNNIYYRKVIVIGRENLDNNFPKILAPNHQNALMDAMAIVSSTRGQQVYLARADIFKKKFIASILYYLKILPVYRIRDGFDNLKQNDEIFSKTIDVLKNNKPIVILPEGNHAGFRRLRQLKKGIFRIALQTEESEDFSMGLKIIPVGLDFSDYHRFRSVLTVIYGKPIDVREYRELYEENPQLAYNKLRDRLSDELKKYMVHIDSEEDYEALDELREMVNGKYSTSTSYPKVRRDKELISQMEALQEKNPGLYEKICKQALLIRNLADKLNVGYYHLNRKKPRIIFQLLAVAGLIALLPFFIAGWVLNYIFYIIPKLPLKNVKDIMFHGSIRYAISLILGLIFLPLYAIIAFIFIPVWWLALIAVILIIPSGIFAWNYTLIWQKLLERMRVRKYVNRKNPEYSLLGREYSVLLEYISRVNNEIQ